jgi:hypothetical protein
MEASEPSVVGVAVAVLGNIKPVPVLVVVVPVKLPVQLAPVAQQAMLSAASREQFVPCLQHAFALPRDVHGFVPLGQLFSARWRIRRTSKARRLDTAFSAGEKGAVFDCTPVKTVAAIQIQETRILG